MVLAWRTGVAAFRRLCALGHRRCGGGGEDLRDGIDIPIRLAAQYYLTPLGHTMSSAAEMADHPGAARLCLRSLRHRRQRPADGAAAVWL